LTKNGLCGYNIDMITVGVRNLKNQLSQYLDYVKSGESVIITEHNRIIAEIRVPKDEDMHIGVQNQFEHLSREGKMLLAKRNVSCVPLPETREKIDWWADYEATREDRV
jgi:antitoxin (DNA-binding transcriptional repressor) of toxin-antitoxin stability system